MSFWYSLAERVIQSPASATTPAGAEGGFADVIGNLKFGGVVGGEAGMFAGGNGVEAISGRAGVSTGATRGWD